MRTAAWVVLGAVGVAFWTGLGAELGWGHVLPDAAAMTVAFLVLNRDPLPLAAAAAALGYVVGRQALAPVGLHETALVVVALALQVVAGHLVGSGAFFFAALAGAAVMAYHATIALLLVIGGDSVGFSSWSTALLVPSALFTFVLAFVSYPIMQRFEQLIAPAKREELSWH